MATGPVEVLGNAHEPDQLLHALTGLQKRTRTARARAGWFPLMVFGVVLIGADQVYRMDSGISEVAVGTGFRVPKDHWFANIAGSPPHNAASLYWVIAVPLAFVLSGLWLWWRSNRVGLRQSWLLLITVGLLPFAALVTLRLLVEPHVAAVHNVLQHESPSKWLNPVFCIALGVLAIGLLERSRPIFTVCAAVVALNATVLLATSDGVRNGSWKEHLIDATIGRLPITLLGMSGVALVAVAAVWLLLTLNTMRSIGADNEA